MFERFQSFTKVLMEAGMKKYLVIRLAIVALLSAAAVQAHEGENSVPVARDGVYGLAPAAGPQPTALHVAVQKKMVDTTTQISGTVTEVCPAKGCWMMLADGDQQIRVTFKDYGFFVPSSLKGKTVVLQGVLQQVIVPEADRKHYAEDAGASEEELAQITGDATEYSFEATGVKAP